MPTPNSLDVQALPQLAHLTLPRLAVGMPITRLQHLVQVLGDEHAPHFTPAQEPNRDGAAFQAVNGQIYYRPDLRVAQRSTAPLGPEVRFLKDPAGTVRLLFELEEAPPPGLPDGAEPLSVKPGAVTLSWQENGQPRQQVFASPTLVGTDDPQAPGRPDFRLRVAAELRADEVDLLYRALSSAGAAAQVTVTFTCGYWVDESVVVDPTPPPPGRGPRFPRRPWLDRLVPLSPHLLIHENLTRVEEPSPPLPSAPVAAAGLGRSLQTSVLLRADLLDLVRDQAQRRETRPDFRNVELVRTVPFFFDPALEHNRPIYSAVVGDASLSDTWENIGLGLVRAADFPNTVYRLPDEIRLAYNADLGAPHVIPTLYRGADDEVRVRVLLRAAPWYDPATLVALRDLLRKTSGGALSAANVVMGGYEKAVLRLGGAFPEQIRALGGATQTEIGLEGSFELVLDLSLEFYRLLAELLVGPVGLTGEVDVTLKMAPDASGAPAQTKVFHLPLRLQLGDVANLPADVRVASEAVSPGEVQVINTAGAEARVGGCAVRLLQFDTNSVAPLEVFEAAVQAPAFPATLAPGAELTLRVGPRDATTSELWNAVQVELLGHELTAPAREVMDRIHELAPSGAVRWTLTVESPLLTRTPLPPAYANLHRIEVRIESQGFAAQQVVLSPERPQAQVTLDRTLREIVGDAAGDLARFSYRVRNIYLDRPGPWGEPQIGEGSTLFVFPQPAENP